MNKILIQRTEDEHDCETCGCSWEESYMTEFNGEVIGKEAVAYCFGAENTSLVDVLISVLFKLGYVVEVQDD